MRRVVRMVVAGVVGAGLVGFLVAASGVVSLSAEEGHWNITGHALHFVMRRSVAARTRDIEPPSLDDPALVARAAPHYDAVCAPCHGSPLRPAPIYVAHMVPPPPELADGLEFDPPGLFYLVKNGVKMTGMPAWPTQLRDDEVWSMVAFLLELPTMTTERYRALALGPPTSPLLAPRVVLESCARCHGVDGVTGEPGAYPRLAAQKEGYLRLSLEVYASGERPSAVMKATAATLTPEDMGEAAAWYAAQPQVLDPPDPAFTAAELRGEQIAREGDQERRIAACAPCHGPGAAPRNPTYPDLAWQDRRYLKEQLMLFQQGFRGGTPRASIMATVSTHALTDAQIEDVSAYYAAGAALPLSR